MERREKILAIGNEYFMDRMKVNRAERQDQFRVNQEKITTAFLACLSKLFKQAYQLYQAGEKGVVQYLNISYLLSSRLTGSYEFRLDLYDEQFYLDETAVCGYWKPDDLIWRYQEDLEQVVLLVRKQVPRLMRHEMDEVRLRYMQEYDYLTMQWVTWMVPAVKKMMRDNCPEWSHEIQILYGGYMDQFYTLNQSEKEDKAE